MDFNTTPDGNTPKQQPLAETSSFIRIAPRQQLKDDSDHAHVSYPCALNNLEVLRTNSLVLVYIHWSRLYENILHYRFKKDKDDPEFNKARERVFQECRSEHIHSSLFAPVCVHASGLTREGEYRIHCERCILFKYDTGIMWGQAPCYSYIPTGGNHIEGMGVALSLLKEQKVPSRKVWEWLTGWLYWFLMDLYTALKEADVSIGASPAKPTAFNGQEYLIDDSVKHFPKEEKEAGV